MTRRHRRSWQWPLASIAFAALLVFLDSPDPAVTSADREYVQRVVDGDTLVLGTGEWVRLIGVDTPETKHPNAPVEYLARKRLRSLSGLQKESGLSWILTRPMLT
jgi:endonuclease YncB( thermonuclease family)